MSDKHRPPTTDSARQDRSAPSGGHLNGVPLNARTLLLALGLLLAIMLLAEFGYRIVGVGPTDMTLPAALAPPASGGREPGERDVSPASEGRESPDGGGSPSASFPHLGAE